MVREQPPSLLGGWPVKGGGVRGPRRQPPSFLVGFDTIEVREVALVVCGVGRWPGELASRKEAPRP